MKYPTEDKEDKLYCLECREELKVIYIGDGLSSFLGPQIMYCENKKCSQGGLLTIYGTIKKGSKKENA